MRRQMHVAPDEADGVWSHVHDEIYSQLVATTGLLGETGRPVSLRPLAGRGRRRANR